jgi:hypothetical protein
MIKSDATASLFLYIPCVATHWVSSAMAHYPDDVANKIICSHKRYKVESRLRIQCLQVCSSKNWQLFLCGACSA